MRSRLLSSILLAACLSAQQPSEQRANVFVTVTDDLNRFVTGLESEHFEIRVNGASRPVTAAGAGAPIAIAVVGPMPTIGSKVLDVEDELVPSPSITSALERLKNSKQTLKVLIVEMDAAVPAIAADVRLVRAPASMWSKVIVELKNQYLIQIEGSESASGAEVILKQPKGLPPLKVRRSAL